MLIELRSALTVDGLGIIPAQVNGEPTIAEVPDSEARAAINSHKATTVKFGAKANWRPVPVKRADKAST